tara:strand:- start:1203 stop:3314 length:2112 start_codon:yes stop_codon:yes gene_type:complete
MNKYSRFKTKQNGSGKGLNVMLGNFTYFNKNTLHARFVPLGIGMIAQYAKQKFGDDINVSLFTRVDAFLEKAKEQVPDIVGLSIYFWADALNKYVVKRLREMYGNKVTIILGGPSIDSDANEQKRFLSKSFPDVDAIIINEGEIAFSNVIERVLSNKASAFKDPIDGLSFLNKENEIVSGRPIGTSMDLTTLGSPYLSGLLDDFMDSDYQPLIQTSRFCPYTCAFCVSGKNRGKLRGFPIEQVEEELRYVSQKYVDRPQHCMHMADENFGILARDVEIAKAIRKCKEDFGYPQKVFFYNDKRFTGTSREVIKTLGDMTRFGLTLSLQTENPESLKAINRRNVTEAEILDAMNWAIERDLPTTTELIFGLPHETRDSFVELMNRCIKRGYDSIYVNMLIIMDGIELNRPEKRKEFAIKTKFRPLTSNYASHDGNFIAEHEEVVISSKTFSYEDYLDVRTLNFMFYSVFNLSFQKWFVHFLKNKEISLIDFFSRFMNPDRTKKWPKEYIKFVDDFKTAIEGELFNTREEMVDSLKKIYKENGNQVGEPTRINICFGARLIYEETSWTKDAMIEHLKQIVKDISKEDLDLANSLVKLGELERIELKQIKKTEDSPHKAMDLSFDVIEWKRNKFKKPLHSLKMPTKSIRFISDHARNSMIKGVKERLISAPKKDFFTAALDFVSPRSHLLHILKYDDSKKVLSSINE